MNNSVVNATNIISKDYDSYGIDDLFYENSFRLFKDYCRKQHKLYLKDLEKFDFNELYNEKGFGEAKIQSIINRWNQWKSKGFNMKYNPQNNHEKNIDIQSCYKSMSVKALGALSIDSKIIQWLEKNHIETIGMIEKLDLSVISTIPNIGKAKYKRFIDGMGLLKIPENSLYKLTLHLIKDDEHFNVFKRRAINKETLQYIADSKGISRERVRQLELRIHQRLKGYFAMFSSYIISNLEKEKIFDGEDLNLLFDNIEDRVIIKYSLKSGDSDRIVYCEDIKKYIIDENKEEFLRKINSIILDDVPEVFNYYEGIYPMEECLEENDIGFLEYDDFISYIMKHGYKRYKDYIWKGSMKLSKCYSIIVKEYFKEGIKLSDDNSIEFVRKIFKEKFGREDVCENNRAIAARIESDNVLCDRGTYISPDYIDISVKTLEKIKMHILNFKENSIFIADLYRKFEEELLSKSNINNRYFLHGILKYYYGDEFIFTKDNIVKDLNRTMTSHEIFGKFLSSKNAPVSKKEIRKVYPGWTDSMFNNAVSINKDILYWDNGYFISARALNMKKEWTSNLRDIVKKSFDKNNGYTNANIIYKEVKKSMSDFIKANNVKNSFNLYSILEYNFGSNYYFRRPHILEERPKKQFTTMDLFYTLIENKKKISYDEFYSYFKNLEFTERTIYNAFHKVSKDLIEINDNDYVLKKDFNIDEESIKRIKENIKNIMRNIEYLPLRGIENFDSYPVIGYGWNSYLLEAIVKEYIPDYRIIEKYFKDRRYKCSILVKNNSSIKNISDLIVYIIKNEYDDVMTITKIQEYLQEKNIILKVLPKEVWDSEVIWVDSNGRLKIIE